jgi:hypothetical protein
MSAFWEIATPMGIGQTSIQIREDRATQRDREAALVIEAERVAREAKTARLRALRLAREASGQHQARESDDRRF